MAPDRIYPNASSPPNGAYYNVNNVNVNNMKGDQRIPPPATYRRLGRGVRRNPCCCCLMWFIVLFIIIVFLLGLAVLIFWLVVHPKAPQFHVQSVTINGLSTAGTSSNNTSIDYDIMARNPNKKLSFDYSNINVKVEESGNTIGQTTVAGFWQGHRNTTYIKGAITDLTIPSSTLQSIEQHSTNVPLYAEVNLKVKVKVGAIKTWKIKIRVECNVNVDLTATNQLKSSSCKVHW